MTEELRGVLIVPLIIALVGAARTAGFPSKFAGLLAVALGLAIAAGAALAGSPPPTATGPAPPGGWEGSSPAAAAVDWLAAALRGAAYGLMAAGLYSGTRAAVREGTADGEA